MNLLVMSYFGLLCAGIGLFVLYYLAQFRIASLLRQRYPQQWAIIAEPEQGRPSRLRLWMRLQHVLRSPALPALQDRAITGWQRVWRLAPWLAWACWLAAMVLQWSAHSSPH